MTDVVVADTQAVRAGQTLVKLDDTEASVAFAQAKAQLAQAVRQVANAKISNTMYVEAVNARRADTSARTARVRHAQGASVEIVAPEELARARAVAGAQANLAAAQAQLDAARALGTRLPVDEAPAVVQAAAQFKLAYRNLKRTTIVAPVGHDRAAFGAGRPAGRAGVPLMSIVQLNQLWIEANFKEGQIRHMRIGQPVEVVSDLYGSRVTYRGRVQGFSAGTGSAFSMLPSQNAAGNWIKVVQRVPVVIALDARDLAAHPLRVGLSMRATVDARSQRPRARQRAADAGRQHARARRRRERRGKRRGRDHPRQSGRVTPARELGAAGCHDRPAARRVAALASAFKRLQHHHHPARHPTHQTFPSFPAPTFAFSPSMSAPFKRVSCLRHRRPCLRDYSRTARCACAAWRRRAAAHPTNMEQYDEQQSRCRLSWVK